ncbi:MAG: response regulator, partial [Bacteroidota bacterium]
NAIKFTRKGSVTVSAAVKEERMLISVQDTGIGIATEQLERIFDSFQQGDGSTAREFGGTGLGLSITRQLVELHGGELRVDSEPAKGSTFYFDLPISKEKAQGSTGEAVGQTHRFAPPPTNGTEQAPEPPQLAPKEGSYRILVVDDEPVNRRVLKNHLASEPYLVTTAVNGEEALQVIESGQNFDLVLLDVMMPRMSGFEVCQKIRDKFLASELPIIMVTAKNQVSDLVSGLSFGANDYIVKPFSKQELLARIKTHLNLQHIHQATRRFVPYEFLRVLGKETITEVQLGDQVAREGTVMFSDIRGYTSLAEEMTPSETFAFLNAYLSRMGPNIQAHGGFVNQFYGDGIMALFLREPEDALKAAIGMMEKLNHYNHERANKSRNHLEVGIGLHSGALMMGMIGDAKRLDTGLVADSVNMTSRIEGLTKVYGAPIILSQAVKTRIQDPSLYTFRYLGQANLKGRSGLTDLYECLNGLPKADFIARKQIIPDFEAGLQAYLGQRLDEASAYFQQVLKSLPNDRAAQYYLNKIRREASPSQKVGGQDSEV